MKKQVCVAGMIMLASITMAQESSKNNKGPAGTFSLGTRNSFSFFSDDGGIGTSIGGQARLQFSKRINTEWFFDYISSKNKDISNRNDYHIGWSIMYYPGKQVQFLRLFQPYLLVGHCFDYTRVIDQQNKANSASRWSMATQAGAGIHINITPMLDCSVSSQYMLHFGKDIEAAVENNKVIFEKSSHGGPDGHLLCSISFNYKLAHLW